MKITNQHNLPDVVVQALSIDKYSKGDADASVTQLIDSPRVKVIQEEMREELKSDISDNVFSVLGTAVHGVFEEAITSQQSDSSKFQHSDAVERICEERLFAEESGWKISGAMDLQQVTIGPHGEAQVKISDFKVTSVWSVIFGKTSWETQLNAYAWLVRHAKGREHYDLRSWKVSELEIIAVLRDWQRRKAEQEDNYPSCPIAVIPVKLWSEDEQDIYMKERVAIHQKAIYEQLTHGAVPFCTDEERWKQPDKFAVMKKGRVRAIKLHDNLADADEHAGNLNGDHYVEERAGRCTRCADDWCKVSQWCDQYQSEVWGP